jgi:uncharacterized protein (DUF433 family)
MKVYEEIDLEDFQFWSGGADTANSLSSEDFKQIESMLEELYPEGCDKTKINDIFWFERDTIEDWIGHSLDGDEEEPLEESLNYRPSEYSDEENAEDEELNLLIADIDEDIGNGIPEEMIRDKYKETPEEDLTYAIEVAKENRKLDGLEESKIKESLFDDEDMEEDDGYASGEGPDGEGAEHLYDDNFEEDDYTDWDNDEGSDGLNYDDDHSDKITTISANIEQDLKDGLLSEEEIIAEYLDNNPDATLEDVLEAIEDAKENIIDDLDRESYDNDPEDF